MAREKCTKRTSKAVKPKVETVDENKQMVENEPNGDLIIDETTGEVVEQSFSMETAYEEGVVPEGAFTLQEMPKIDEPPSEGDFVNDIPITGYNEYEPIEEFVPSIEGAGSFLHETVTKDESAYPYHPPTEAELLSGRVDKQKADFDTYSEAVEDSMEASKAKVLAEKIEKPEVENPHYEERSFKNQVKSGAKGFKWVGLLLVGAFMFLIFMFLFSPPIETEEYNDSSSETTESTVVIYAEQESSLL